MNNKVTTQELQKVLPTKAKEALKPLYEGLGRVISYRDLKIGNGDKEAIQPYKNALKDIKSFRIKVTKVRKEVNKPYANISKTLLDFEKDVNKQATEALDALQIEFKPYIEQQQKKKEELQKRREAKEKALIEETTKNNDKQLKIIEKLKIKAVYNKYYNDMLNDTINAIDNYNEKSLLEFRELIDTKGISFNASLFETKEIEELGNIASNTKKRCFKLIDDALNEKKSVLDEEVIVDKVIQMTFKEYVVFVLNNALEQIKNKSLSKEENKNSKVFKTRITEYLQKLINKIK